MVGRPRNYGIDPREQEVERQRLEKERQRILALDAARKKKQDEAALAQLAAQYEEWVSIDTLDITHASIFTWRADISLAPHPHSPPRKTAKQTIKLTKIFGFTFYSIGL